MLNDNKEAGIAVNEIVLARMEIAQLRNDIRLAALAFSMSMFSVIILLASYILLAG